ncbi:hypothetical protein [Caloramator sp. Dgby_cultured_2]|uniref:hypothetical protein n=1 Tax=Caloramator sp. Dgby_cultured_2 TaxID=3029174 RepID=UPI00237DB1ED|nr:hypothetical protein [Caloramator sp. Dgby_cultured_2]WDU82080.1 hypothetical protein PWK10_09805 [Caloramator sp. Dgby_cultured_2]
MIEELLECYRDMLLVNFRRVKEINKGRAYYDSLKDLSSKNKRKFQISLMECHKDIQGLK